MKNQKQILTVIIIIVLAALVWVFYLKDASGPGPDSTLPVAEEDDGKFIPELNNTLETSVRVINPNSPAGDNGEQ